MQSLNIYALDIQHALERVHSDVTCLQHSLSLLRCEYEDYITHETEQKGKFDFVSIKMRAPPQPGLENGINQSLLQDQSRL